MEEKSNVVANPFGSQKIAEARTNAVAESDQQRAIAETQAAMIIAKRFPRNQMEASDRVMTACTRPTLAEHALYSYARGGTEVTGPSIRMAEVLAQNWGNIKFGIRELDQRDGESSVEAFAWDMETNTYQTKTFQVPHIRYTRNGTKRLEDPRDIYELVANQGARRLRACILGVIPGDVIEAAVKQCELTLRTKIEVTPELIKSLLDKFEKYKVTKAMIEARIQRHIEVITPALVVQLGKIYNSLEDGMSGPAEWFDVTATEQPTDQAASKTGTSALRAAVVDKKDPAKAATDAAGSAQGEQKKDTPQDQSPTVTFDKLRAAMEGRTDVDTLDADATLIGQVPDIADQNRLAELYKKKRKELTSAKKR